MTSEHPNNLKSRIQIFKSHNQKTKNMENKNTNKNESIVKDTIIRISKDPVIKVILIVTGALTVLYLAGIVFRIAAGTIFQYKQMNRAIIM